MIAPLREPNTAVPERRRLSESRQYLATTLLDRPAADRGPAIAPWKAWAMVGWMVVVSVCYAGAMLGWW